MRIAILVALVMLGLGVIVALPETPLTVVEEATACELSQCVPHEPICFGPHERPRCI